MKTSHVSTQAHRQDRPSTVQDHLQEGPQLQPSVQQLSKRASKERVYLTLMSLCLCLGVLSLPSGAHADLWDDWDDEESEVAPLIESYEGVRARSRDAFDEMYEELGERPRARDEVEEVEEIKSVTRIEETRRTQGAKRVKKMKRVTKRRRPIEQRRATRAPQRRLDPPKRSQPRPARGARPSVSEFEAEVLALVNRERARGGDCGGRSFAPSHPLRAQRQLAQAARQHALSMAEKHFFDHRGPQGDTPKSRIDDSGYQGRAWGENIAAGQRSPQTVVRAWMKSPGHCRNILNPLFSELGVSFIFEPQSPYKTYWVQAFGTPR